MRLTDIREKAFDALMGLGLIAVTAGLVLFPSDMVDSARDGVELCFNVIIPSLFPFFVISSLTVELGLAEKLGRFFAPVMRPLFNVGGPCASALVLGFIGGYPVGARTVTGLYRDGQCTRSEAERMLSFCNNSGPAFIFGVVGAGLFASGQVGLVLYLAHILASLTVGVIFRKWGSPDIASPSPDTKREHVAFPKAFVSSVTSSFSSSLNICGFVIFFTVLIKLLFLSGVLAVVSEALGGVFTVLGLEPDWAEALLTGIIELTSGVWSLRNVSGELTTSIAMAAFMLGWAGLSVHCQVLSFLGSTGLSVHSYILGKCLHGILSAVFVLGLARLLRLESPVSAVLAEQVGGIADIRFTSALMWSALMAAAVFALFLIMSGVSSKKDWKATEKSGIIKEKRE